MAASPKRPRSPSRATAPSSSRLERLAAEVPAKRPPVPGQPGRVLRAAAGPGAGRECRSAQAAEEAKPSPSGAEVCEVEGWRARSFARSAVASRVA